MRSIEDRLDRLESQYSFLELSLEEMSQTLLSQQASLTNLSRALDTLTKQLAALNHASPIPEEPETPPHY